MKSDIHPLSRSAPHAWLRLFRRAAPGALAAGLILGLSACTQTQIREEHYQDGARKSQSAFIRLPGDAVLRHGIQVEWYPGGGQSSLDTYVKGYRQGYSMRWHPNGRLKSVEHYTDGLRDGQSKSWDEDGNLVACSMPGVGDCQREAAADGGMDGFADRPDRFAARP